LQNDADFNRPACCLGHGPSSLMQSQLPHHFLPETVDRALARERNQSDLARLARLKAHRRSGGDVEPHAARLLAVELQRRVGLEKLVVRADLDRPIAGIGHRQRQRLAAGIEFDLAVLDEHLAGDHCLSRLTLSTVIPGRREAASPESITTAWEYGFRACAWRRAPE